MKKQAGFLCLLLSTTAFAAGVEYNLDYAPDSPIKDLPLSNAQLKIEIYQYDKPHGYHDVKTDEHATFRLDEAVDLEIVSIKGEDQYQARCSGSGTVANRQINIRCQSQQQDNQPN